MGRGLLAAMATAVVASVWGCEGSRGFTRDSAPGADADAAALDGTAGDVPQLPIRDADAPGPVTPDSACAAQHSEAPNLPVNILILLDASTSMGDGNPRKWDAARRISRSRRAPARISGSVTCRGSCG